MVMESGHHHCLDGSARFAGPLLLSMVLSVLHVGAPVAASEGEPEGASSRFELERPLASGGAEWLSWGQDHAAFGTGRRVTVANVRPEVEIGSVLSLEAPATQGVVARNELYLVQRIGSAERLTMLGLEAVEAPPRTIPLLPQAASTLHLGRMDDYLLVAEDGYGLRILQLPGHHHEHGSLRHHAPAPAQVGLFPLQSRVSAVGASLRWIYLATEEGLVVIDANVPEAPRPVRRIPLALEAGIHSVNANGSRVYLLTDSALHLLDVSRTGEPALLETYPEVSGRAMNLLGRRLYVADEDAGVQIFHDAAAPAATIFIQVGDFFFNPPGVVNVNAGDTVEWQKPSTSFPHNVFSCNSGQFGCGGATATELFVSGGVTTAPFNFSHTFTLAGSNPYVCQAHAGSMQGDITVTGGAPSPPGVPDGSGATDPMTVDKLDPAGVDLGIAYDTGCPDANGHDIVFGTAADLPATPGGTFSPAGGRCGIGTSSPFVWTATPAPSSGDFAWWLIVADDGSDTEGSWGKDGNGQERTGPGTNGASQQCGNTDKDLTNTCGQ